jgi:hypothetical protein
LHTEKLSQMTGSQHDEREGELNRVSLFKRHDT